jgi:hypothetical protein
VISSIGVRITVCLLNVKIRVDRTLDHTIHVFLHILIIVLVGACIYF